MIESRIEELQDSFWAESEEEYTQEWRDELTVEERAMVAQWDRGYVDGLYALCRMISKREG